ncbi:MAG: AsmA family protein [Rhizobiaceae bacterium]
MKRLVISMAVLLLFLAGIVASLPLFVSSGTVRSYILDELESLTGRNVSFRGDPGVAFNPFLGVEISDLSISDPLANPGEEPLLNVSKVQAQLDLLPALFGEIKITQYRLVRPQLNMKVYSDGSSNWNFKSGKLNKAFQSTVKHIQNSDAPDPQSATLGTFSIVDGIIRYEDTITGQTDDITSINGTVEWPSTSEAAIVDSTAIWHGENVISSYEISDPLRLMAGGESNVSLQFESAPARITFSGTANMLASLFVKGNLELRTPSLKRFSEFLVAELAGLNLPGSIEMTGSIEATTESVRLADTNVNISGHSATGVLSLTRDEVGNAAFNGTLAFDTIDLSDFLAQEIEKIEQLTSTNDNTDGLKVDLRMSANVIDAGIIELEEVAAALNVTGENWTFDIGDSQALGGTLIARIGKRLEEDNPLILMDLTATDVDAAAVSDIFPDRSISLTGKGTFSANLRGKSLTSMLNTNGLNGSVNANLSNGSIVGIDIPGLLSGSFNNTDGNSNEIVLGQGTSFETSEFRFFISNGIASISQSSIDSANAVIQMIGRVDLRQGNLALRAQEITEDGPEPERLFIGGTLKAPLVSLKYSKTAPPETEEVQAEELEQISN